MGADHRIWHGDQRAVKGAVSPTLKGEPLDGTHRVDWIPSQFKCVGDGVIEFSCLLVIQLIEMGNHDMVRSCLKAGRT